MEAKSVVGVVLEAPEPVREEALWQWHPQFGTAQPSQGSRLYQSLIQDFFKQLPTNDDEQEASVQTLPVHFRTRFCSRSETLVVAVLVGVPQYPHCFQNVNTALTRTPPQQAETLLHVKLGRLLRGEDVCTAEMQSRSDLPLSISLDTRVTRLFSTQQRWS